MVDTEYPDVMSPEEEEEERRRSAAYDVPPVVAPGASKIPGYAKEPAVAPPTFDVPPAGNTEALRSLSASPKVAPPTQTPAQNRLRTLTEAGAPPIEPLHGFKKGLDILGQIAAPGIEQRLRYQPQAAYAKNLAAAQGDVAAESAPEEASRKAAQETATTEKTRAETENLKAPETPKVGLTPEEQFINDALHGNNGQPKNDAKGQPYTYLTAHRDWVETSQQGKPEKAAHVTYDAGIPVSVTDEKGKTYDVNDPKLPDELKPLAAAAERAHGRHTTEEINKEARAANRAEKVHEEKQNDLTAQTKGMVEAAPKVLSLSQRVRSLIDKQEKDLGPAAGRWNELMAGKVGSPNAEFTKLRTDVGLLQTLLMRMHVGARGGEHMMAHFKDLVDSGKQSPENLRAALDEIDQYANDVAKEGEEKGVHSKLPAGSSAAGPVVYKEGNDIFDIPPDKVAAFEKSHPKAKKQ